MPWSFIIPAAASLIGGSQQADAAQSAAQATADATNRATELQRRMYDENVARQKPFYDVGVNALPELVAASKYTNFGLDQFQQDPGYAFRLSEGQKQLERNAAARGGLISGGALKAAQRYGQEMGSQEYMNAFNRYQTERAARLNPLQSLTGMSQTTANTLGAAGQNMASNVGAAYMNQGVNQGNALMSGVNARTSSYGDIAKLYGQTNPNFGNLFGGGGGGGGGAAGYNISPEQYSGYFGT
jgi:hypothetical protein